MEDLNPSSHLARAGTGCVGDGRERKELQSLGVRVSDPAQREKKEQRREN